MVVSGTVTIKCLGFTWFGSLVLARGDAIGDHLIPTGSTACARQLVYGVRAYVGFFLFGQSCVPQSGTRRNTFAIVRLILLVAHCVCKISLSKVLFLRVKATSCGSLRW